jgi:MSHA biogenesis protein MshP
MTWRAGRQRHPAAHGLGAVAVILVLVVLASIAAAVVRIGQQTQGQTAQGLQGARATAAARAGAEWGLYQAFKGSWTSCNNASQTLDLGADGGGLRVTVTCKSQVYNEGESAPGTPATVRIFTIDAVACTSHSATTACPDATAAVTQGYVERWRQVQATN